MHQAAAKTRMAWSDTSWRYGISGNKQCSVHFPGKHDWRPDSWMDLGGGILDRRMRPIANPPSKESAAISQGLDGFPALIPHFLRSYRLRSRSKCLKLQEGSINAGNLSPQRSSKLFHSHLLGLVPFATSLQLQS